ncbi:MAG: sigma-54-dependent Fis family transcriptional regulator [Bacteroidales bacterium]|nr:sigma-54-dependent Fis family transcriptional regulator [Bacteroidales bacterium]
MEKRQGKILIVDDNKSILDSLKLFLEDYFGEIITTGNPNRIPQLIAQENFDVVLLDMNFSAGRMTGNEGFFWLKEILRIDPLAVVVHITAYGDIEMAVRAIKEGATDFILKPWDNYKLLATLQSAYNLRRSRLEVKKLRQSQKSLSESLGNDFCLIRGPSKRMDKIYQAIPKIAQSDASVLITGENGTGKELIAREIHKQSNRSDEVFMRVDLGSLNENLFESELFGHVKGAFTDAREDRIGKIESASGGTLFLDEIGNLSLAMQSKLLTVLQNKEICPLGSSRSTIIDVRFVFATNKDLEKMIQENAFREDLFYRINTVQLNIPPLRERADDIPEFIRFFLDHYTARYSKPQIQIHKNAWHDLQEYSWPGNIRELQHAVEKAVILSTSRFLKAEDLVADRRTLSPTKTNKTFSTLEEAERLTIISILEQNKGNLSKTARELKIGRQTLYNKLKKYKL